jgi:MoaA/NifB/PqqE/SkfB family radical SAM enzyme
MLSRVRGKIRRLRGLSSQDWRKGPTVLQLDVIRHCNEACIYCNVKNFGESEQGLMPLDIVSKVLKETAGTVRRIHCFKDGEVLLDGRLPEILKLCKTINPKAITVIYTNGSVTANRHFLVDPNLDEVHFTVSAASPEVYAQVHGKPFFNQVVDNIEWFLRHRTVQKGFVHFVIVRENVKDLEIWKERFNGLTQVVSMLHDSKFQPASKKCIDKLKGVDVRGLSTFQGKMAKDLPCTVFNNLSVGVNGELLQCCDAPYKFNYGRVGEISVAEAWQRRNENRMCNEACRGCNLRRSNWKEVFEKYLGKA